MILDKIDEGGKFARDCVSNDIIPLKKVFFTLIIVKFFAKK